MQLLNTFKASQVDKLEKFELGFVWGSFFIDVLQYEGFLPTKVHSCEIDHRGKESRTLITVSNEEVPHTNVSEKTLKMTTRNDHFYPALAYMNHGNFNHFARLILCIISTLFGETFKCKLGRGLLTQLH